MVDDSASWESCLKVNLDFLEWPAVGDKGEDGMNCWEEDINGRSCERSQLQRFMPSAREAHIIAVQRSKQAHLLCN